MVTDIYVVRRITSLFRHYVVKEQYPMLTPFSRFSLKKEGVIGLVYMLHHICEKDPNRIPTNEELKVSPSFLEKIILTYKNNGFDFLSLDDIYKLTISQVKPEKPFVAFTIDDGYLDNYTNALPIFEKYAVPFCIFVTTDFIDKKAILWWDVIEDLLLSHDSITIGTGKVYPSTTFQQRWDSFRYLRERILKLDQCNLEEELNKMFDNYDIDWYKPIEQKGMAWEHVKTLAAHPLCTIGGHTISHPALNKLSHDEAKREIYDGIIKIEQTIGKQICYFAYPYGSLDEIGPREWGITHSLGMKLSFMAHFGCLTNENIMDKDHLSRVYLKE